MKRIILVLCGVTVAISVPLYGHAQNTGISNAIGGLQSVLDTLYANLMPQASQLIAVGQGIGAFGALWFIAVRVWRSIADAEPVDVFPLFRPFVLGFAIVNFPLVLNLLNAVLSPTVSGTGQMLGNANASIATLLQQKEIAIQNSSNTLFGGPSTGSSFLDDILTVGGLTTTSLAPMFAMEANKIYENTVDWFKLLLSQLLQILYEAAALVINTLRTFNLIVLAILGPIVFGLAVFDGFQHSLIVWLARYINVYLWLAVTNILGAIMANIQVQMLQLDIAQIQATGGTYFSSTDAGYLIFLIIGIISYFSVPSITNYIVNIGGHGALSSKTTAITGIVGSRLYSGAGNLMRAPGEIWRGYKGN